MLLQMFLSQTGYLKKNVRNTENLTIFFPAFREVEN